MKPLVTTAKRLEKAVLVGLITRNQKQEEAEEYLAELAFLAETAGATPVKKYFQRLDNPDKTTFVGKGKLQEITSFAKENEIDLIIFDDELSPSQQRNIEKETGKKILDRNLLILGYFRCTGENISRQNASRTGPVRISVATTRKNVDAPGPRERWDRNERRGRKRD